ncbi:MAG: hypothetical protein QW802_01330 [Candidatus Altiarchaeota archaeon]
MKTKKSQAAVEYLQNYGFAILIVLIMGVALWHMGVFNVAPKTNIARGFNTIKVLEPSIKYIKKTGTASERVTNNLNFVIVNTGSVYVHDLSLTVGGDCNFSYSSGDEILCSGTYFKKTILGPSETTDIANICCKEYAPGDPFWVLVNITYYERVGEQKIQKKESGVLQGFVE